MTVLRRICVNCIKGKVFRRFPLAWRQPYRARNPVFLKKPGFLCHYDQLKVARDQKVFLPRFLDGCIR